MEAQMKDSMVKTGTTILGIVCKDGIVMAGDRRATIGHLIMVKDELKVEPVRDNLLLAGCGSAVEIQKIQKILQAELKLKEVRSKKRPSVHNAASLLSNIRAEQSAFLLGGFNEDGTYALYEITGGYIREIKDYSASLGSGMAFVLGFLERSYKKGITVKEGTDLAVESLKSSTQRDIASGNGIDIFTITKDGIKKVVEQTIEPNFTNDKK